MTALRAFRIQNDDAGHHAGIETMTADALSPGEVLIKVAYSSVNYKDALAGSGKGRILRESMILGTAGFTAALALLRMQDNRQTPEWGPIAVTGASGGVGQLA